MDEVRGYNIYLYYCNNTKIGKSYLLYLSELKIEENGCSRKKYYNQQFPDLSEKEIDKYPCIYIGYCKDGCLKNIKKDKQNTYKRFKNHERYYKEFMDVLKYVEKDNSMYVVGVKSLCYCKDKQELYKSLVEYTEKYTAIYSDNIVKTDLLNKCSKYEYNYNNKELQPGNNEELQPDNNEELQPDNNEELQLDKSERHKLSNQRYREANREYLRFKAKEYYQKRKQKL